MRNSIIAIALSGFIAMQAAADELQLQDNPPDRYVVVKGDTLWDISGKFLKQPWRWPEIWKMNKQEIKNPNLIYPGDLIVLDRSGKYPQLRLLKNGKYGSDGKSVAKLSPQTRIDTKTLAIPAIPTADIEPFISRPLVIEKDGLESAAVIVATQEDRVLAGTGSIVYAQGLSQEKADYWQIYRRGNALIDPDNKEILGYEAVYLGQGKVAVNGDPATVEIVKSTQEINVGDRLLPASKEVFPSYVPHAPEKTINARVMSTYGDSLGETGRNYIISLNKGSDDGLEIGHVLALYRHGADITPFGKKNDKDSAIKLPDERYGLAFIFRTFNRVSYALVIQSTRTVRTLDNAQNP